MYKKLTIAIITTLLLTSCGSLNNALLEKHETVEYYRIFNIKTDAERNNVIKAASRGLAKNTNKARETRPIPKSGTLPNKPGRFRLTEPFKGTNIGGIYSLAGGSNVSLKIAECDDAIWIAKAERDSGSSTLNLTACLFQYKQGYHLDLYATFNKTSGGIKEVTRQVVYKAVGTPEQWVEKTFLDIVKQIRSETGATFQYLEGYPEPESTPWLD